MNFLKQTIPIKITFIFSHWGIAPDNIKYEYYEKFVSRVANLSYENFQDIKEYSGDAALDELNLKDLAMKVRI